ncbi:MAG TPA: acetylglutamate kinase [Candidatus Baltobacteraceae bacterium]|jgi:acetylglutamate kinase|nr:acetylglutamate kinase [Candidatus Baltobacteraceae bacterium]
MLIVIKYGGNAMAGLSACDPLLDEIAERVRGGDQVVLVHGGGPQIDDELALRGVIPTRVAGLRVTDAQTLAVTEFILCGTVNKALVRSLARRGVAAVGVSGEDGGLLIARPIDPIDGSSLGFVGEVVRVDPRILHTLLDAGYVPVIAPLGRTADAATALNLNGDTAAGAIAGALSADAYVVLTNVERVRRRREDPESGIAHLRVAEAEAFLTDGTLDGGMQPKVRGALAALHGGVRRVMIAGAGEPAIERALQGAGTTLTV